MTASVDEIDAKIITLLETDGRRPNTELARKLGIAEATVRKRIDRLLRDKIIQIGAWPDPLRVGYQTYAIIEIEVDPPRIEQAAEGLAKLPEIFFLGLCTGAFDFCAAALFLSNAHMEEFITRRLSRVAGIRRTSTSHIVRIIKRENAHPLPAPAPSATRRRDRRSGPAARRPRAAKSGGRTA